MNNLVAFYPYKINELSYINLTQQIIESEYNVIDYKDLKLEIYDLLSVRTIYLNWLEDKLDKRDKALLTKAKFLKINIIWVFHNKITHDTNKVKESIDNIKFLINISSKIILLSHSSINYLKEYEPRLNLKKVFFIPHLDFVGDYGKLSSIKEKFEIDKNDFVFALYGRICPYKNIEILIKAFQKLNPQYNCKLIIAGKSKSEQYINEIKQLINGNKNIYLSDKYIQDLEMGAYLDLADIVVLPYNIDSGMNSGAMIMAFSYKKTVIVSNIAMADEYDDGLIYKYSYVDEKEHIDKLTQKMEEAYCEGKQRNIEKGIMLYNQVVNQNTKDLVKEKLICLL